MNSILFTLLFATNALLAISLHASQAPTVLDHGVERVDSAIPTLVSRVFDGKEAQCESLADVGFPAYRLSIRNVQIMNDSTIAEMRISNLICMQNASGFALVESSPVVNWPNSFVALDYSLVIFNERYQVLQEVPVEFGKKYTDFTLRLPSAAPIKLEAFIRSLVEYNQEKIYKPFGSYFITLNSPQ